MEAGTGVPLKARAAAVKDPGSERALAVDVLSVGQAKAVRWIKVHHALHCGAMEDAEALLVGHACASELARCAIARLSMTTQSPAW